VARTIGSRCPKSGDLGRDLGGDHDRPIVDGELRVVALQRRLATGAHHP